jgi:hypothetical protein
VDVNLNLGPASTVLSGDRVPVEQVAAGDAQEAPGRVEPARRTIAGE